jgi:NAD(P)-dependent dehydrogenase (short-subunit alcohol dehydrogenase family)
MGRLDNKVAIITGASSGMGLAAAELFVREGAQVVGTGRRADVLTSALAGIEGEIFAFPCDARSETDWKACVDFTLEKFGKVDILVNNAGESDHKTLLETSLDDFNAQISENLTSVWLGMREVIPHMQKLGKGSIINCSSVTALMGGDLNAAAYCSAKGGVRALSKHAAVAFGKDHIRVNTIYPGPILSGLVRKYGVTTAEQLGRGFTDTIPLVPHAGDADEIANAYLYLASDESNFVTGQDICVDGGWTTGRVLKIQ